MVRALLFLSAMLVPLGAGAPAPPPFPSGDTTLDRAIQRANADWAVAMRTGDSAKLAEPYEDQAVFVTLDGSASRGRAQIEAMTKERFARAGTVASTKIEPHHIVRNGDLAVEMGAAESHWQGANRALVVAGGG